jgi:antibiotic biosynthesis monooxygenase (ABM) superfamily enzyme
MIYHVASGTIEPGKEKEAEEWLLELADYVNQKFPGAHVQIARNINGANDRAHYMESFDSLSAWESASATLRDDGDWQALLARWQGLVVAGSVEHNFYRVIG